MSSSTRQPVGSQLSERERRPELIRPEDRRRRFPRREAQRRLQQKEIAWAPVAYAIFFAAIVIIFSFAYVSYAFSRYRGVILPGVHVNQVDVSGMSETQAANAIEARFNAVGVVPVVLKYGSSLQWRPTDKDIGFYPQVKATVQQAMRVGRSESFVAQLIHRLPLHPSQTVQLLYTLRPPGQLRRYVVAQIARGGPNREGLFSPSRNAGLRIDSAHDWRVYLLPARPGTRLDVTAAVAQFHQALGSLRRVIIPLRVRRIRPQVTNADAASVRTRVNAFLARPPIVRIGRRVIVTTRATFGPMFSFTEPTIKSRTSIRLNIDSNRIQAYISALASGVDREAQNARLSFSGGQVEVVSPKRTGRTLDQAAAFTALQRVVTALKPGARLRFGVKTTQPPLDLTNPASVGISRLLAAGRSSFPGGGDIRLKDITAIAQTLNNQLIPPGGEISFNNLAGIDWQDRVYNDAPTVVNGQLEPGEGGAMQQVATAFLRALYGAGLQVIERHGHTYRLPWYEPPIGLDALVAPGRNWDLRFQNTTKRYLLLQTDVQPIRQEVTIYVFGPRLRWRVTVGAGRVTRTYPHGPQIVRRDPSLGPGDVRHLAFADDGAATTVQRTIRFPNGSRQVDQLTTVYQPSQAILSVGMAPTPTPTPRRSGPGGPSPTAIPTATGVVGATPTPTFNH